MSIALPHPTPSTEVETRPREVKLVCLALHLWSGLTLAKDIARWRSLWAGGKMEYPIDLGVLAVLAAIGLWRLSPTAWKFARLLTWYWLIGSVLLYLQLFAPGGVEVTSDSRILAEVPDGVLRVLVFPFFAAQLWQLYALQGPHMQALFARPAWRARTARSPFRHAALVLESAAREPRAIPRDLQLLCLALLLWNGLTLAFGLQALGVLAFLAAIGVWRFSRAGRTFALFLTWY